VKNRAARLNVSEVYSDDHRDGVASNPTCDNRDMHATTLVLAALFVGCGGSLTSSDGGVDATTPDAKAPIVDASPDVEASVATITLSGTSVVSPGGTTLTQVTVCVFEHPELPCATSDSAAHFSIGLARDAETGITLVRVGYASVLFPLETAETDISGYELGIPSAASRTTLYAAFGATFPDSTNGLVMFEGTLEGQNELGLVGVTGALNPASGTGPFYVDASGNAAPSATSTSTYSEIFFAGVAPSTYVGQLSPTTMSCYENFGGWTTQTIDGIRFPVAAGFETHVGLDCHM
jgi:hypothetical protein